MTDPFSNTHPFVHIHAADKARGIIIGSALGDALGLYTEFISAALALKAYPDGIIFGETPLTGDSHRDKFTKGSWTDDTDQALLLVLSVLHHYGASRQIPTPSDLATDFARRLRCWCEQGLLALLTPRLGLGQTIATVALAEDYLDNPAAKATHIWNRSSPRTKPASNGSLMRCHPLGVLAALYEHEAQAFELAVEVSRITHADPRCSLACCALLAVLRGLLRGVILSEEELDNALERTVGWAKTMPDSIFNDLQVEEGTEMISLLCLEEFSAHTSKDASYEKLLLDESYKIGYIYKCLGSGIYALRQAMRQGPRWTGAASPFVAPMMDLIMQGGDADTNATVAGALLGAWFGESALPQAWIQKLNHAEWLKWKTVRFVAAAGIMDDAGRQSWILDPKDDDADINGGRQPLTKEELDQREIALLETMMAKRKVWEKQNEQLQNKGDSWPAWKKMFGGNK